MEFYALSAVRDMSRFVAIRPNRICGNSASQQVVAGAAAVVAAVVVGAGWYVWYDRKRRQLASVTRL